MGNFAWVRVLRWRAVPRRAVGGALRDLLFKGRGAITVGGAVSSGYCARCTLNLWYTGYRGKKFTSEGTQSPCSYGGGSSSGTLPRSLHLTLVLAQIHAAMQMKGHTDGRR